ncbi:MAG: methyltransferase domain-containing protein [Gemmatimonadetes bacterium]|nr:class I SAM-dependent methyltransferase [Gemmatimonadota bacterium]NIQ56769.1 class I SAM-dependent methyltransferase [Gemmatimonadota bacterium]NIU76953.1 methyltransferase domain-containing protein [Gammaproteobacteria bacterium]NIX46320.1 methyltransferase domain-containing protein [Gemmatimonadota bacterium]NIY10643.1 methyltransferase domain-containing protein [Gemmatimonadota bacterium]
MDVWERVKWDVRRLYHQGKKVVLRRKIGESWVDRGGFRKREYPDYETYVEHQKTKFSALRSKSVEGHDRRFHASLSARLAGMPHDFAGASVLCLAARQGSEVRAFIDQGAFAVGIDLNPGVKNPYVVVGDFHDLQYAADSVDWVYTNSLDHAFDLDRILGEVKRVLRPTGGFIVEANVSSEDGAAPAGPYEAMVWDDIEPLVARIRVHGFAVETRQPFERPWVGEQFVFRLEPGDPAARAGSEERAGSAERAGSTERPDPGG